MLHDQFRAYRDTLQPDRRRLLEKFQIVDAARKVVGVGSVGTRAGILPSAAMSAMLAPSAQSHRAECRSPVNDGLIVGE
jgi:hypothetical protein